VVWLRWRSVVCKAVNRRRGFFAANLPPMSETVVEGAVRAVVDVRNSASKRADQIQSSGADRRTGPATIRGKRKPSSTKQARWRRDDATLAAVLAAIAPSGRATWRGRGRRPRRSRMATAGSSATCAVRCVGSLPQFQPANSCNLMAFGFRPETIALQHRRPKIGLRIEFMEASAGVNERCQESALLSARLSRR